VGTTTRIHAYPENIIGEQTSAAKRWQFMNQHKINHQTEQELLRECGVTTPSAILRVAIAEDSKLIMDWLWYGEQMETEAESRYCFERVLCMNPRNAYALRSLEILNAKQRSKLGRPSVSMLQKLFQIWIPKRTHRLFKTDF
jgi:hypothetical protein